MPASPLEGGLGTRTMSSGSLVIVDKADSSTEHETQPPPPSVSQTGELPQEIEVCCHPLLSEGTSASSSNGWGCGKSALHIRNAFRSYPPS